MAEDDGVTFRVDAAGSDCAGRGTTGSMNGMGMTLVAPEVEVVAKAARQ